MSEREKLLPCPFCGGKPRMYQSQTAAALWRVCCENCDAGPHSYLGEHTAANHWNTRSSPSAEGGEVDAEERAYQIFKFREWRGVRKDCDDFVRAKWAALPDHTVTGQCNVDCNCEHEFYGKDYYRRFAAALSPRPAPEAQTIERLREPFKFADEKDWSYLDALLLNAIRHQEDAETKFWWSAMRDFRDALALTPSHRAPKD